MSLADAFCVIEIGFLSPLSILDSARPRDLRRAANDVLSICVERHDMGGTITDLGVMSR